MPLCIDKQQGDGNHRNPTGQLGRADFGEWVSMNSMVQLDGAWVPDALAHGRELRVAVFETANLLFT